MKQVTIMLTLLLSLSIGGVSAQKTNKTMKILVAYFSHSGNTRTIAGQIQKATGADIFEIEVKNAYPSNYQSVVDQAKKEINAGVKPDLKSMPENLAQYDVIFIGSPNWWSTIAPPVATFLTNGNFSGKTVIPFVTHGGGGIARCEADVKKLCPESTVLKGFAINGSTVQNATPRVQKWLQEIGITD